MNKLTVLRNKKGFTLIEIIVVLVILAVMAAAGIPTMIGFVEEARGKAHVAEARVGFVAAQSVATELAVNGTTPTSALILASGSFEKMTEDVDGGTDAFSGVLFEDATNANRVTGITYEVEVGSKTYKVSISKANGTVVS